MDYIVHIRRRENPYALIDKNSLRDPHLSLRAKGMLAYALSFASDHQMRVSDLTIVLPDGMHVIQSALVELAEHGYAELRTIRGHRGRVLGKRWFIYETPELSTEKA